MNGPDLLRQRVGGVRSRMGGLLPSNRVLFRGHDLHVDLQGLDWMDLYMFGITGRRFSSEKLQLMHAIWVNTSYPDPRIWNNRVAALAGSARSTSGLGIAGALAVSEAHIYGRGIDVQACEFFIRTRQALEAGDTLEDCIQRENATYRRLAGYGRPMIKGDERLVPMMATARALGLADGPHLRLANDVEQALQLRRGPKLSMNYGGLSAALGADLGLTSQEYSLFTFPAFLAGMVPCFTEASQRTEGSLFPIPTTHVRYTGAAGRAWGSRFDEEPVQEPLRKAAA
jgi:hypothetical protein